MKSAYESGCLFAARINLMILEEVDGARIEIVNLVVEKRFHDPRPLKFHP
jgi:hypothetical protein